MELDDDDINEVLKGMVELIIEAMSQVGDTESRYVEVSSAMAEAASVAFFLVGSIFEADEWQSAYAQSLFLHCVAEEDDSFRISYSEDVLIPGAVEKSFLALDEWFTNLEKKVMPARAAALLRAYGDEVDEETRAHWKALADKMR